MLDKSKYDLGWFSKLDATSTALLAVFTFFTVFFAFKTMKASVNALDETRRMNAPAVSVKIAWSEEKPDMIFLVVQNTGGSAAYDVNIQFDPDLPYKGSYSNLNSLPKFKDLPLLEKNEKVWIYLATSYELYNTDPSPVLDNTIYPKEVMVSIEYNLSQIKKDGKDVHIKYKINLKEDEGRLYIGKKTLHDLVNEMEELKQALVILLSSNIKASKKTMRGKTKLYNSKSRKRWLC